MRLEWSGRAERGNAPHRAALVLVARSNYDDGDEERKDSDDDDRSGNREIGGRDSDENDDGGSDGGWSIRDARDGIRRVRAIGQTRNLSFPLIAPDCTRGVQRRLLF